MKLGIAFSGGGLKGVAHLGVLQALLENGIRPNMVAGTSAGSVVAALYAIGMSVEEMLKRVNDFNLSMFDVDICSIIKYILRFRSDFYGFLKGRRFEEYIKEATDAKKLFQATIPLAIIATDIETGCQIVYASQEIDLKVEPRRRIFQLPIVDPIYKAVRASCSVPVVFKPVNVYNYSLVDGGIKDNVPVDILRMMGAEKIIAVNIGFSGKRETKINTPVEFLMQTIDIMGNEVSYHILKDADYIIKPKVYDVGSTDFSRLEESIERGYLATLEKLQEIKATLAE